MDNDGDNQYGPTLRWVLLLCFLVIVVSLSIAIPLRLSSREVSDEDATAAAALQEGVALGAFRWSIQPAPTNAFRLRVQSGARQTFHPLVSYQGKYPSSLQNAVLLLVRTKLIAVVLSTHCNWQDPEGEYCVVWLNEECNGALDSCYAVAPPLASSATVTSLVDFSRPPADQSDWQPWRPHTSSTGGTEEVGFAEYEFVHLLLRNGAGEGTASDVHWSGRSPANHGGDISDSFQQLQQSITARVVPPVHLRPDVSRHQVTLEYTLPSMLSFLCSTSLK